MTPESHEHRFTGPPGIRHQYVMRTWAVICQEPWCYERRLVYGEEAITERDFWDDRPADPPPWPDMEEAR